MIPPPNLFCYFFFFKLSLLRPLPDRLLHRILVTSDQYLCHRGVYFHYCPREETNVTAFAWSYNFELVVLQVIVKVAGTGNKGIVTSVFNCQLTSGLLFINMVYIIFKIFINNGESTWYKFWKLLQNVAHMDYILKMIAQTINFL